MRRIIRFLGARLSLRRVHKIVGELLASQGVGSGAAVSDSGETRFLREALADLPPRPVVFDVGANMGDYAAAVLAVRPDAAVTCFEPSPTCLAKLAARFGERVSLMPYALAAASGTAQLYSDTPGSGLASLTQRQIGHFGITLDHSETVRTRSLDEVVAELGVGFVDLLKLDVEGHELDVLQGGRQTIAAQKCGAVQFEFGGANIDTRTYLRDFFSFFRECGYGLAIIGQSGLVPLARYSEALEQFAVTNFVARPLDAVGA